MLRKDFIYTSLLGIASSTFLKFGAGATSKIENNQNLLSGETVTGYLSESGFYGKEQVSFIGILTAINPAIHESNIKALRNQYKYRTKLTYHTNDKFKAIFSQKVFEYFVTTSDLSFIFKKVNFAQKPGPNHYSFAQLSYQKIAIYNELLREVPGTMIPTQLNIKYQSLNGPNSMFTDAFATQTTKPLNALITRDSDLLQLSSFLCGCIASDFRSITRSNLKNQIVRDLKSKLNIAIDSGSFNTNISRDKIKIII